MGWHVPPVSLAGRARCQSDAGFLTTLQVCGAARYDFDPGCVVNGGANFLNCVLVVCCGRPAERGLVKLPCGNSLGQWLHRECCILVPRSGEGGLSREALGPLVAGDRARLPIPSLVSPPSPFPGRPQLWCGLCFTCFSFWTLVSLSFLTLWLLHF